jgi:tetratricopeptide (TPR) repeat protein
MTDDRLEVARQLYERAVFGGDPDALPAADRELDALEAGLCLARGRIMHARALADQRPDSRELALFERAMALFSQLGDQRGEAEAAFWIGTYHQVLVRDQQAARPALEHAHALAVELDDKLLLSYVVRHLGFVVALADGDLERARPLLEESLHLRRELDFRPGVAAALLALAELEARAGHRPQALALLDEAQQVATASRANGILVWIERARGELAAPGA